MQNPFSPSLLPPISLLTPHHPHMYTPPRDGWVPIVYTKGDQNRLQRKIKLLCARSTLQLATI